MIQHYRRTKNNLLKVFFLNDLTSKIDDHGYYSKLTLETSTNFLSVPSTSFHEIIL
jgi:hypothetical protein